MTTDSMTLRVQNAVVLTEHKFHAAAMEAMIVVPDANSKSGPFTTESVRFELRNSAGDLVAEPKPNPANKGNNEQVNDYAKIDLNLVVDKGVALEPNTTYEITAIGQWGEQVKTDIEFL